MLYNLYYTLNINLPTESINTQKRKEIIDLISKETKQSKNQMYILLILEHACNENITTRDDILKGILPFDITVDSPNNAGDDEDAGDHGDDVDCAIASSRVYINDEKIPDKLLYILEKAIHL
jgi:hypothetical protein